MQIFLKRNNFIILALFFYIFQYFLVLAKLDEQIKQNKNEFKYLQNIQNRNLSEEDILHKNHSRFLQSDAIRIQFDLSFIEAQTSFSSSLLNQLINLFKSVSLFYSNLISVKVPISGSIEIPSAKTNCNNYVFTATQKSQSYLNADLLIFVDYQYNSTYSEEFSAESYICETDSTNRVIISYLSLTFKNISLSLTDYESSQLQKQVIHEVMHSLAMNIQLVNYFRDSNNNLYDASVVNITNQSLSYPNTLNWAKNYYGCSSLTSIPIEIDSLGNIHWNRVILLDDIMSGLFIYGEGLWSGINNAILEDSGWYTISASMYDTQIKWGKNKQCQFVQQGCTGTGFFQEFCITLNNYGLTFSQNSMGICEQFYPTSSQQYSKAPSNYLQCLFMLPVQNQNCLDPDNQYLSMNQYVTTNFSYTFGYESRVFESTLTPLTLQLVSNYGCFKTFCSSDNSLIKIIIGSYTFYCQAGDENIKYQTPFDLQGSLVCPESISDFCISPGPCQNFCSSAGYCMNKTCTCIDGYSGLGCECSLGKEYYLGSCRSCSQTCKTCSSLDSTKCESCIDGYYLLNGECLQCGSNCLTCSNLNKNECTSCAEGFFLDALTSTCQICSINCLTCTSISSCSKCQDGFGLNSTNYCSISCMFNCQKCSLDAFSCSQCYNNKQFNSTSGICECPSAQYQDPLGDCQDCKANCQKCTSKTNCLECQDGYKLLAFSQTCVLENFSNLLRLIVLNITFIILF